MLTENLQKDVKCFDHFASKCRDLKFVLFFLVNISQISSKTSNALYFFHRFSTYLKSFPLQDTFLFIILISRICVDWESFTENSTTYKFDMANQKNILRIFTYVLHLKYNRCAPPPKKKKLFFCLHTKLLSVVHRWLYFF